MVSKEVDFHREEKKTSSYVKSIGQFERVFANLAPSRRSSKSRKNFLARSRAVSRLDEGLERSCPRCGMHTVGWSWCTMCDINASGVDIVMMVACQWRHEAR